MKTLFASQRSLVNTRFSHFLFVYGSAENSKKSPPDWGRLKYAVFPTNILTRHVYCPCVELTQSVLACAQFRKHQVMSLLTISRSTLHASAVEMTLEAKAEWSTRIRKDEVYATMTLITLHCTHSDTLNFGMYRIIMFSFMCVCGQNQVTRGGVGTEDPRRRMFERPPGSSINIHISICIYVYMCTYT